MWLDFPLKFVRMRHMSVGNWVCRYEKYIKAGVFTCGCVEKPHNLFTIERQALSHRGWVFFPLKTQILLYFLQNTTAALLFWAMHSYCNLASLGIPTCKEKEKDYNQTCLFSCSNLRYLDYISPRKIDFKLVYYTVSSFRRISCFLLQSQNTESLKLSIQI